MFITPIEYRTLLDLHMCSDPSPLTPAQDDLIRDMLNRLAREAKPSEPEITWVEAYHYYHPDKFGRVWWLAQIELCKTCGQPDNCGDCNHRRLEDVSQFAGDLL